MSATTILFFGRSGSGKSTLITELAEYNMLQNKGVCRVYSCDRGGTDVMLPHIELGIIELVQQGETDPWIFLNKAARGYIRDANGKWVIDAEANKRVTMWAFESMTAVADALMQDLANKAASGVNIGGNSNVNFSVSGDGETLKVGGSNPSHYNIVQTRITEEVWKSQNLPGNYVVWTASVSKDEDPNASGKVLGPAIVGKALTAEVPRWFSKTFRVDCIPAQMGKPERHILYLGPSLDQNAGNAVSLGNTRAPKDGGSIPPSIEPASIVEALKKLDSSAQTAKETIRKRLNIK